MMNESLPIPSITDNMQGIANFMSDAFSPLIQLMVFVIVLAAVISIVGGILYTLIIILRGGQEIEEPERQEEQEPKKWDYEYERRKLETFLNTPSHLIARGKVKI